MRFKVSGPPGWSRAWGRRATQFVLLSALPGTMSTPAMSTPAVTSMHNFALPPIAPTSTLLKASDGNYYGSTVSSPACSIFKMTPAGQVSTVCTFGPLPGPVPVGDLIQGVDGNLYGVLGGGGAHSLGAVFRVTLTGVVTILHSFDGTDGEYPRGGLVAGPDGAFYGTAGGSIYRITSGGVFKVMATIDGQTMGYDPRGAMVVANDGNFYGTTCDGAQCIFKMTPTGTLSIVHSIGYTAGEGQYTFGTLIQGLDGKLYGVTEQAGYGCPQGTTGTVYSCTLDGHFSTIHYMTLAEGFWPQGKLMQEPDGSMYSTSAGGGAHSGGTVFKVTPAGQFTVLHSFDATSSGGNDSVCGLVDDGTGGLLGTVPMGGADNKGFIFRVTPAGDYSLVASAGDTSAAYYASTPPVLAPDGSLYGVTRLGDDVDAGVVYKIAPNGTYSTVHAFNGTDGAYPEGPLTLTSDGSLYGTCSASTSGKGVVFKIDSGGAFSILHTFTGSDGDTPTGPVVFDAAGSLYGTTSAGGLNSTGGTVYKIDSAGSFSTLHTFVKTNNRTPKNKKKNGSDGLYGTTSGGGVNHDGTIFKLTSTGSLITLYTFTNTNDGMTPMAPLSLGADGTIYGTSDTGTVFKLTTWGGFSVLASPGHVDSGLVLGQDGNYYGVAWLGAYPYFSTGEQVFSVSTEGAYAPLAAIGSSIGAGPSALCALPNGRFAVATAIGGTGQGGAILKLTLSPPPSPTGFTATGQTSRIALNWSPTPGATGYNLYRTATQDGQGTTLIGHNIVGTSSYETNLANGTHYAYWVTALNEAGESAPSARASATVVDTTAHFVKLDTSTMGNWRDTYGAEGYNVIGDTSAGNPHYRTGLTVTPGAHNSGVWAASTLNPSALQSTVAGAPTRIAAAWSQTSWTVNVNAPGGHLVTLYLLDYTNAGYAETITVKDAVTGAVLDTRSASAFQTGAYYQWNVNGNVNITLTSTAGHWAVLSGIFFGGPSGAKSPTAPSTLAAVAGASTVGLTWTASTGATSYDIFRGMSTGAESTTPIAMGVKSTSFTDTHVTAGATYFYKVVGVNAYAGSVASNEATAGVN